MKRASLCGGGKRYDMKKIIALLLALSLMLALAACVSPKTEYDLETADWDQILADMPEALIPVIQEIWLNEVVGK